MRPKILFFFSDSKPYCQQNSLKHKQNGGKTMMTNTCLHSAAAIHFEEPDSADGDGLSKEAKELEEKCPTTKSVNRRLHQVPQAFTTDGKK